MIRVGVIGLGQMGRNHARILDDVDQADLVAVVLGDQFVEVTRQHALGD